MRKSPLLFLPLVAACTTEANHLGNPLLLPVTAIGTAFGNGAYNQTRGKVELFVKTNHPALIADIRNGGGPALTKVFDIADVPKEARDPHTLQLQSDLALYANNYDALVVAIMVVSG